jgi:hypothetical protein
MREHNEEFMAAFLSETTKRISIKIVNVSWITYLGPRFSLQGKCQLWSVEVLYGVPPQVVKQLDKDRYNSMDPIKFHHIKTYMKQVFPMKFSAVS